MQQNEYQALDGNLGAAEMMREPATARKFPSDRRGGQGFLGKVKDVAESTGDWVKSGQMFRLPIKGLTLVKVWSASMFCFAAAMGMTW